MRVCEGCASVACEASCDDMADSLSSAAPHVLNSPHSPPVPPAAERRVYRLSLKI